MSQRYMCISFVSAIFFIALLFGQSAFSQSLTGLRVIKSTEKEIILEYSPVVGSFSEIKTNDGLTTFYPGISSTVLDNYDEGAPSQIIFTENITVPAPDGFLLQDFKVESVQLFNKLIAPTGNYFAIDQLKYNQYKLPDWVKVEYAGIARNKYIAMIKFTAARYNSVTHNIEVPTKITAKIIFNDKKSLNSGRLTTDIYNNPISLNYFDTPNWIVQPAPSIDLKDKKKAEVVQSISNGTWLKIRIDEEGIYKLDAAQLSGAGANISSGDVATIKIFGNGGKELSENVDDANKNELNDQSIIVRTKENGELNYILFYGSATYGFEYENNKFKHYINHFSKSNYYLLTWGGSSGKRASYAEVPSGAAVNEPISYTEMLFLEEETYMPYGSYGSGREWLGRNLKPNESKEYTNMLQNLEPGSILNYDFSVAHSSNNMGTMTIKESGNILGNINLNSLSQYVSANRGYLKAEISANKIIDSRSTLSFQYSNPDVNRADSYIDWYEIFYHRYLVAINNQISLFTDPKLTGITQYSVNQFQGDEIIGYDVTNPEQPLQIKNIASTGGMFIIKTELTSNQPKRFFVSSNFRTVSQIEKTNFGNLRTEFANTDIIIITHPDLIESAQLFKDYRIKKSGLSASIIRVDHIFNEFGSGLSEPTAIRDFIAFAYNNWKNKPKYVVLWGDGHYDYKNINYNNTNFVLPYESTESYGSFDATDSYVSDDYYARLVGNDKIIDISLGRLPIDSPENGIAILEKIKHYENSSSKDAWRTQVTLVADDAWAASESSETFHVTQSESLSVKISYDIQQKKLFLPEYPAENIPGGRRKPLVTDNILSTINTGGTLMLNWIGHGNPRVWAHEEVLDRDRHIPQMYNLDKLYFLTAATCDYGRHDMPFQRSGSEEMLMSRLGSSIGGFSATRLVYASDNAAINEKFYEELFIRESSGMYSKIGDVLYRVKQKRFNSNDEKYNLIGDPTLKLLIPDYVIKIDSINGKALDTLTEPIELEALLPVKISGRILKQRTDDETDETYNGVAVVTMLDGDENFSIKDVDSRDPNRFAMQYWLKHGGALNRSSYKITNGRFVADFIIPKDISFSEGTGRLYVFGASDDDRFAKGSTRSYKINGINTDVSDDKYGPDINVFLDSRNFNEYDVVRPTPLLIIDLFDKSGLNTTGKGIGHRIEAWLDDSPESIDMTPFFNTSLEQSGAGSAEKILYNLEPGVHKIKVRAWDVYNNHATGETYFRIESGSLIYNLFNYPNPVINSGVTKFEFSYNMNPPLTAALNIYNSMGQLVYSDSKGIGDAQTGQMEWDCTSNDGLSVSQGPYYYMLNLTDIKGNQAISTGSLAIIK